MHWPGSDPESVLGRRSTISLKIPFMWALAGHLLAAPEYAWACGREAMRRPRLCCHRCADDSHVFNFFFIFRPENAILVVPQCFAEAGVWMRKR